MDKGAHYYRCDLQVHSPRDTNWTGREHVTEGDRYAYATELVHACRERGLQAIAITDHHDMMFLPLCSRSVRRRKRPRGKRVVTGETLGGISRNGVDSGSSLPSIAHF